MLIRYSFAIGLNTCWTSSRFAASSSLRTVAASGRAEVIGRNRRRSAQTACSSDGASRTRTGDLLGAIRERLGIEGDERGQLSRFRPIAEGRIPQRSPALL